MEEALLANPAVHPAARDELEPPATASLQDADLARRLRAGDRDAFRQLVDRYQDKLVGYLGRLSGDAALAEDLAQEAFVRFFRSICSYDERGSLQAYLYRIASRLAYSARRRTRRRRGLFLSWQAGACAAAGPPGPQEAVRSAELQLRVRQALDGLPLRLRIPLVLHALEGLSIAEIAAVTRTAEGTVKSRIHRGRARLRRDLAAVLGDGGKHGC
ncbi:MAG: sigma-70 family RNA polymerase sigma factor [Deltaproteobacteria bacterium]|nr:sigma-70 family RNA polymerase sigma factor [Deltaproteobacteria bacterium]